jgi:hypothetical protein
MDGRSGVVWFGLVGFSFNASLEPQPRARIPGGKTDVAAHCSHEIYQKITVKAQIGIQTHLLLHKGALFPTQILYDHQIGAVKFSPWRRTVSLDGDTRAWW